MRMIKNKLFLSTYAIFPKVSPVQTALGARAGLFALSAHMLPQT